MKTCDTAVELQQRFSLQDPSPTLGVSFLNEKGEAVGTATLQITRENIFFTGRHLQKKDCGTNYLRNIDRKKGAETVVCKTCGDVFTSDE